MYIEKVDYDNKLLSKHYEIRYEVYCVEKRWELYSDIDSFDFYSDHYLIFNEYGIPIGAFRVVCNDILPLEDKFNLVLPDSGRKIEVSRLSFIKQYRGRNRVKEIFRLICDLLRPQSFYCMISNKILSLKGEDGCHIDFIYEPDHSSSTAPIRGGRALVKIGTV